MRNETFSFVYGYTLSLALLGIVGCAIDESEPDSASEELAVGTTPEPFNSEHAAAIAKAKIALLGTEVISPQAAACGTAGPISKSERVNDAAFTGTARQRTGSSTSCTALGALQPTDDAIYFCYTVANDGTWTYNENMRTRVRGWTRDDLLRPPPGAEIGGARNHCGF